MYNGPFNVCVDLGSTDLPPPTAPPHRVHKSRRPHIIILFSRIRFEQIKTSVSDLAPPPDGLWVVKNVSKS